MKRDVGREARLLARHPLGWLACGFGSGLSPWASGTTGSAAAVLLWWLAQAQHWDGWVLAATILGTFLLGIWASGHACRVLDTDDAAPIVIDEWVGQWLTLAMALPFWGASAGGPLFLLLGFLLFRLSDIVKPWPARTADRQLGGGFGAMADDAIAGIYSGAALALLGWSGLGS